MLIKVDEMYNILKSLLATGHWSGRTGLIKLLLEFVLECPDVYFVLPLLSRQVSSPGYDFLLPFIITLRLSM